MHESVLILVTPSVAFRIRNKYNAETCFYILRVVRFSALASAVNDSHQWRSTIHSMDSVRHSSDIELSNQGAPLVVPFTPWGGEVEVRAAGVVGDTNTETKTDAV